MEYGSAGNAAADALAGGADVGESGQREPIGRSVHLATIVEEIASWRAFLHLRQPWDERLRADPDAALLSHDWWAQVWKASDPLRHGERPCLLCVRAGSHWRGCLPLRFNPRTRRLCFLGEERSQRLDGVGADHDLWLALGAHCRRWRAWDRLDLQFLRPASAACIETEWPSLGLVVRRRGSVRQRRIRLDRPWPEIEASFSSYLRANFKRRWKRLRALGAVALEVRDHALQPHLDECFALEAAGWKGARGTAILADPLLHRFYRQLAYRFAASRRLRLYCLRVGRKLAAFELCLADPATRSLSSLKIAYCEDLATSSPGIVLRWLLLQAAQPEIARYEFLGDDAPWKAEWTPDFTTLLHLRVYNRTPGGFAWRLRSHLHGWLRSR